MKFTQAMKMALSSIRSNKMRSFLTMLGIIIGVMAITLLVSLVQGATDNIMGELEALGGYNLNCMVTKTTPRISFQEVMELEQKDEISLISIYTTGNGTAKAYGKQEQVSLYGINRNYQLLNSLEIEKGRYLNDAENEYRISNCVIGAGVAKNLFGSADVVNETIRIDGKDFMIVGILKEAGSSSMNSPDLAVYLPFLTASRLLGVNGVQSFDASAEDGKVEKAEQTLNEFLMARVGEDNYTVFNMGNIMDILSSVKSMLTYLLGGIGAISLIVGGVGIMNIMLVSVTERTREIGIRKAIGAQRGDIIIQFLIESIVLSVLGGLIGLLISGGILGIVNMLLTEYHFEISLGIGMMAVIFSIGVGVLFGIYPARKAARLKPIDALRFE